MARKIKEIAVAPQPKATRFGAKAAGALLFGTLSLSCAPETIQINAKSPIAITAAQPKAQENNPALARLSENYFLTEKEKTILEKAVSLEKEKTAFWPSKVFESLLENRNLRENHLEKCSRLIESTLKRIDSTYAKNTLDYLGGMFESEKVGGAELDIMLNLVEGGPELGPKHMLTIHNVASIFQRESYSPEFLKQMQLFLNDGGVMGNYVAREEKMLVLNAFHGLSTKGINHSETFAAINGIFELLSERIKQLAPERRKRAESLGFDPRFYRCSGVSKKDIALVALSSFTNPNLNQQMFEDLVFELEKVINSKHVDSSASQDALGHLAELYSMDFFDSRASSALRKHFEKYLSYYGELENFLESALAIAKGRKFRYSYSSYLFVGVLEDLDALFFQLSKHGIEYKLPIAAKCLANERHYPKLLEELNLIIKELRKDSEDGIFALSCLSQNKSLSPESLDAFSEIFRKISRIKGEEVRGYALGGLAGIINRSKNLPVCLGNTLFILEQKRSRASTLVALDLLAELGIVDDASFPEKFWNAKRIAEESGADYKNPEVCLNFAHALEILEERSVRRLHEEYGIEYFMRYPKELLQELLRSLHPRHKELLPIAFVIYNKDDWNGAFYSHGGILAGLTKTHRLYIIEVNHDSKIPEKIVNFLSFHESRSGGFFLGGKIDTLLVGGHGSPNGILLGHSGEGWGGISSSDVGMFRRIRKYFVDSPTVVLVSCSTGKNEYSIGARISKALGARLFAPKEVGGISSIKIGPDGDILDVEYNVPSNEFESGKIKQEEGKE